MPDWLHPYFAPCTTVDSLLRELDGKRFPFEMHLVDLRQLQPSSSANKLFDLLKDRLAGRIVYQLCLPGWLDATVVDASWFSKICVRCLHWPAMFDQNNQNNQTNQPKQTNQPDLASQIVAACKPWLVTLVVPYGVEMSAKHVKVVRPSPTSSTSSTIPTNQQGQQGQISLAKQPPCYC